MNKLSPKKQGLQSDLLDLSLQSSKAAHLLNLLIDPGSVFLPIAMNQTREADDYRLYSGMVSIMRRNIMILMINTEIQGGIFTPSMVSQINRVLDICIRQNLPAIFWGASGGANLLKQDELFVETGGIYYRLGKMKSLGLFTCSVITGIATAGGAYIPGMCQFTIATKNAEIYLAGPPLVKAAIGQSVSGQALGSAKMHAQKTGLVDLLVDNHFEAAHQLRQVISNNIKIGAMSTASFTQRYDKAEWWVDQQFQTLDFLQSISKVEYYQPDFEQSMICAYIQIGERCWGVISTQGPIHAAGAKKAANFLNLLNRAKTPVLFIQNTVGFMVGVQEEQRGVIVNGAELLHAIASFKGVKVSLHVGPSYGAGYYALCARSFDPDFIVSWPCYHLAVMGGKNAAKVMREIKSKKPSLSTDKLDEIYQAVIEQYDRESSAFHNSAKGRDDCMIDPRDTLVVLNRISDMCWNNGH